MELPRDLLNEITEYCKVNNIPSVEEFTLGLVVQGFTVQKYGATPVRQTAVTASVAASVAASVTAPKDIYDES